MPGKARGRKTDSTYPFNRLGESIAETLHQDDRVLVDGQPVNWKRQREKGKSKGATAAKSAILWSIRANSIQGQPRAAAEVPTQTAPLQH